MIKIRVSSKGQVVIPIEVRARYNIDTGTELELREGPGYVTLHPLPEDPVAAARGLLRSARESRSLVRELLREKHVSRDRTRGRPGDRRDTPDDEAAPTPPPQPTLFDPETR